jgi:hypothetical protein
MMLIQGQYRMVQESLSPCSGPVHVCIYKAQKENLKSFCGNVYVVYFVNKYIEIYYTTNNSQTMET